MGKDTISLTSLPVYDRNRLPSPDTDHASGSLFLIDKPAGWSSFDVVKFLRYRIKIRKTGHAGTLDPLATGLLVICAGKATKAISRIQEFPKRYCAQVRLGISTPSQDAATEPDAFAPTDHIKKRDVENMLARRFTGKINQIPPMYSALHKDGRRLYKLARQGEVVVREPRQIEVFDIELVSFDNDHLVLDILCSKGTYVRTLAHDLGIALGSLASLSNLRRTAIGPYDADDAITIEQIRSIYDQEA